MNSRKFDAIDLLLAICFQPFKNHIIPLVLFLMLWLPCSTAMAITVTLHLENEDIEEIEGHSVFVREEGETYDFSQPTWKGADKVCTITNLKVDTTYFFIARTYDKSGNTSDNSNEIKFFQPSSPDGDSDSAPEQDENQQGEPRAVDIKTGAILNTTALDATVIEEGQLASTQWRIYREGDDLCVFDATITPATNEIQIPRLLLEQGVNYYFTARYSVNTTQPLEWTPREDLIDTDQMTEDANQNGIPDSQEADPELDLDGNGTADFLQEDLRCIKTATGDKHIGVALKGGHNVVAIQAMETIDLEQLSIQEDITVAPELPVGLLNFRILVNRPGDQARLTLYLPQSSYKAEHLWYYTYSSIHGWRDYSKYVSRGTANGTLILKVTDGGDGDADGVVNGIVVTQSGPAVSPAIGIGGGNSSRACFVESLF